MLQDQCLVQSCDLVKYRRIGIIATCMSIVEFLEFRANDTSLIHEKKKKKKHDKYTHIIFLIIMIFLHC